jgi:hypothetical protein
MGAEVSQERQAFRCNVGAHYSTVCCCVSFLNDCILQNSVVCNCWRATSFH